MSTKQPDETKYRWYMVNKDGIVTLCADQADAEREAKDSQEIWPHMGPYRAVQLVEASQAFTAADMATAAAQGFRDGQAEELAAMRAGGEPVAEMVPCHTPSGKRVAVISRFQHLPIGTKLYTHPQRAAQDAEDAKNAARYKFLRGGEWRDTDLEAFIRLQLNALWDVKIDAAIAAQQGDINA